MKNILILASLFLLNSSCKKTVADPVLSCEKAAEAYTAATLDYANNINDSKKCQAFVNAAKAFVNDCPTISAADKKATLASIATVNC